jgi:RNA polymerase sigma-70 factor (ECF subfamily)
MTLGDSFSPTLEAARTGAEWAWTELYRDLAPVILGYLRARRVEDPEDVLGEVFLLVVRNLSGFEGDERHFRTWALTIAHRRVVDDHRRRLRRPVLPVPAEELARSGPSGNVEEEGLATVQAERVVAAIRRLSRDQQDVLLLRLLADLTVEEVARVLDKRAGAVKALQRRGLAALKKELAKQGVPL